MVYGPESLLWTQGSHCPDTPRRVWAKTLEPAECQQNSILPAFLSLPAETQWFLSASYTTLYMTVPSGTQPLAGQGVSFIGHNAPAEGIGVGTAGVQVGIGVHVGAEVQVGPGVHVGTEAGVVDVEAATAVAVAVEVAVGGCEQPATKMKTKKKRQLLKLFFSSLFLLFFWIVNHNCQSQKKIPKTRDPTFLLHRYLLLILYHKTNYPASFNALNSAFRRNTKDY